MGFNLESRLSSTGICEALISQILAKTKRSKLISIGDSHSRFFDGLGIEIHHIGPATAFNLTKDNSTSKSKEQLVSILDSNNPADVVLILNFGEIDIRTQCIKTAIKFNLSTRESALKIAQKYSEAIKLVLDKQYIVFIHGVHASTPGYTNRQFPAVGRIEDRNHAVKVFNGFLEKFCNLNFIPYAALDDLVIDEHLNTRSVFMSDGCHLDATPDLQAILVSRFLAQVKLFSDAYTSNNPTKCEARLLNIAEGKPYVAIPPSTSEPSTGIVQDESPFLFTTNKGINQGIIVNLLAQYDIKSIKLVSGRQENSAKANDIMIVFLDLDEQLCKFDIPKEASFDTESGLLEIRLNEQIIASRVAILTKVDTSLSLASIQIFSTVPIAH
jgi:hypothetical protein